jgi:peptide/nickel transport system permease protein
VELGALRSKRPRSLWGDAWRQFRRHRLALGGLIVIGVLALFTLIGPIVWHGDTTINFARSTQGVSLTSPMGTDDLGRDIMWRVLWGGRISLAVGVLGHGGRDLSGDHSRAHCRDSSADSSIPS